MKLLICGSREASDTMLDLARQAAERAIYLGWQIVVGDADGVDGEVVRTCYRLLGYENYMIFGVTPRPRNWPDDSDRGAPYIQVVCPSSWTWKKKFLHRDKVMVNVADRVFAVWNGESGGTAYTFKYAREMGRLADIQTFKGRV